MPSRRFDWHEHIKRIEAEYRAAHIAVDRLTDQLTASPDMLTVDELPRPRLREAAENLEGTYWFVCSRRSKRLCVHTIGLATTIRRGGWMPAR